MRLRMIGPHSAYGPKIVEGARLFGLVRLGPPYKGGDVVCN